MKAVLVSKAGGPEVLEYTDLPVPEPAAGQVLVQAHAIGVGKPDFLFRTGVYPWMPPLPAVLGNELTGRIAALGPGVTGFAAGQAVHVLHAPGGCYAEYAAVPAEALTPLPDGIDLDAAAGTLNYLVAWALLFEAARGIDVRTVYVNGAAGGIGTAVIQLARLEGIEVIAGVSSDAKCAYARDQGATATIDYSHENVAERVLELTDGRGADLVLDHVVGKDFAGNLAMLANLGLIVVFNVLAGLPERETLTEMWANLPRSPAVRVFTLHSYDDDLDRRRGLTSQVLERIADGRVRPHIHARFSLAEARSAHELLDAREVLGKVILKPSALADREELR